jgi:hypothetical protein
MPRKTVSEARNGSSASPTIQVCLCHAHQWTVLRRPRYRLQSNAISDYRRGLSIRPRHETWRRSPVESRTKKYWMLEQNVRCQNDLGQEPIPTRCVIGHGQELVASGVASLVRKLASEDAHLSWRAGVETARRIWRKAYSDAENEGAESPLRGPKMDTGANNSVISSRWWQLGVDTRPVGWP